MGPQVHAPLAPSHSDTWALCPGSKKMESLTPPDEGSEHSRRGTAAHEGLELCLTKDGYTPSFLVGKTMGNGVTLDQDDANAIQTAVNYVKSLHEDAAKHRLPFQIFVEEKLQIGKYLGGRDDIYGTADILFFFGNTLELIDYKHGYTHVEVLRCLQLILYAIGAMAKAYDPKTKRVTLRKVKMTIIQPRGQDKTNPIRSWEVEPDDLFIWAEKLTAAAAATDKPDAPLIPGEKQCKWCRAAKANICPAREKQVRENLEKAMKIPGSETPPQTPAVVPSWGQPLNAEPTPAENPPSGLPTQWQTIGDLAAQDVKVLSLDTRVALLRQTEVIQGLLKDNAEGLKGLAMDGTHIPGYKLIKSLGNTAYRVSEDEVTKKVGNLKAKDEEGKQKKLIALDEYMPRKLISPTQILKLVKSRVTERVYKNLEELTHRPEKGPALVPESAAGTPWKPPVDQMFEKQGASENALVDGTDTEATPAPKLPSFL